MAAILPKTALATYDKIYKFQQLLLRPESLRTSTHFCWKRVPKRLSNSRSFDMQLRLLLLAATVTKDPHNEHSNYWRPLDH